VDLAVYARDITFDPPTVTAGEPCNMTFVVRNEGGAEVNMANFAVTVDGVEVYTGLIHNLRPGAVTDNTFQLTLDEGDHRLSVSVVPTAVEDLAPHNNVATVSVTAHPPGMLVADAGPDLLAVQGDVTYLDASGTVYRGSGVLSYEWDFGDGSPEAFGEYVEHVYGSVGWFTVTVTVSDGVVEGTDTCIVHVEERDEPPHARISPAGPFTADRLTDVVLSASLSSDDREIANVTWDMGDGTVLTGYQASHRYTGLGVYPVTLTVEDSGGLIDVNRTTVEVRNLVPVIDDLVAPEEVDEDAPAEFTVTASDPDGLVETVAWDFDDRDGITFEATGTQVTHSFPRSGTYNVTCIVRDDNGGQEVVHIEVRVIGQEGPLDDMSYYIALVIVALVLLAVALVALKKRTNLDIKKGRDEKDIGRLGNEESQR
jgi:PKD repeat protein